jgi:hypothetical protein
MPTPHIIELGDNPKPKTLMSRSVVALLELFTPLVTSG